MSKPTCARGPDGRFYPSVHGSKGAGWGGPARGPGNGSSTAMRPSAEQFTSPEERTEAQAARAERRAQHEELLERLAVGAENPAVRLAAAIKLHEIDSGG